MSETPIGSIEFLVKFDTMGKEFTDALKEAIDKSDLEGVGMTKEVMDDIRSIKYNVESRLRSGFSGDRLQFLASAPAEIQAVMTDDFVGGLAETLMGSKTGKRIFKQFEEESEQQYLERMSETSKKIALAYAKKVEEQIESPTAGGMAELMTVQPAFQAAIQGNWKYLIEKIIEKLLDESDWERLQRERFRELGIGVKEESASKLQWRKLATSIGTGGRLISSTDDLIDALEELGLTEEQAKSIFFGIPKFTQGIKEPMERLLQQFTIESGVPVPGSMLHTMKGAGLIEKSAWTKESGYIAPDLPYIVGKEFWDSPEKQKAFLEMWDNQTSRDTMKMLIDESLTNSNFAAFIMEGKLFATYSKYLDEINRSRGGRRMQMGAVGGYVEGVPTITGPETIAMQQIRMLKELKDLTLSQKMALSEGTLSALDIIIKAALEANNEELADELRRRARIIGEGR